MIKELVVLTLAAYIGLARQSKEVLEEPRALLDLGPRYGDAASYKVIFGLLHTTSAQTMNSRFACERSEFVL